MGNNEYVTKEDFDAVTERLKRRILDLELKPSSMSMSLEQNVEDNINRIDEVIISWDDRLTKLEKEKESQHEFDADVVERLDKLGADSKDFFLSQIAYKEDVEENINRIDDDVQILITAIELLEKRLKNLEGGK